MSLGRPGRVQRSGTRAWLLRSLPALALLCVVQGCLPDQRDIPVDAGSAKSDAKVVDSATDTGAADATKPDSEDIADVQSADTVTATDSIALPLGCATDTDCKDVQAPSCQRLACDAQTGLCVLAALADGASCAGDACIEPGTCVAGNCAGLLKNCDDGNACTGDTCQPLLGCSHAAVGGASCNDGDKCTNNDTCIGATCKGAAKLCGVEKPDPCKVYVCDPNSSSSECTTKPVANAAKIACTEANVPCFGAGVCTDGKCVGTAGTTPCDDGNPCTQDGCPGPGYGPKDCLHLTMLGAECKVGCDSGTCGLAGGQAVCQNVVSKKSTNQCAVPKCDPQVGQWTYSNQPDDTPCTDSPNVCKTDTACTKGVCDAKKGKDVMCEDNNPCTANTCTASGCTYTPTDGSTCTDGNACTSGDACSKGACAGQPVACDDANPCTTDTCAPVSGCMHNALADGADCGSGKACLAGACLVKP